MPPALSETVIATPPENRSSTARVISGAVPEVSQASRALSMSSLTTTSANLLSLWPVIAVRARASTYCAALDVLNVVLCSLGISSSRRSSDDTDKSSDPKNSKGRDIPKDAPVRLHPLRPSFALRNVSRGKARTPPSPRPSPGRPRSVLSSPSRRRRRGDARPGGCAPW
jgi:hypothetical protein